MSEGIAQPGRVASYANNLGGQIIAGYIQINHLFAMLFNLKA